MLTALALAGPLCAQGPGTTGVGSQFELTYWQSVESGNDPALYEAYLAQYPNGTFAAVARVKLAKLRQLTAPAPAPLPAPLPAPVAVPAPEPPPVVTQVVAATPPAPAPAAVPAPPAVTARASPPALAAPASAHSQKQLASTRAARSAPVSTPLTAPKTTADSAPYVTAAEPAEVERSDSDALRRLLGALGDSQRVGVPAPAPIVETGDVVSPPEAAPVGPAAPLALPPAPLATPSASPPRLPEATGQVVTVPDAIRLSQTSTPATDPHPIAVGPLPPGFMLPPRPQLAAIPPLAFPASFCSAEARNAFHDGTYVAAVELAKRNNDATIAYMRQLQDLYDSNQLTGDSNSVNAVAAESQSYSPVAAAAFAAQSTLVSAFSTLMSVPIRACEAPKQP